MTVSISRIINFIKFEFKYQQIKNMKEDKFEDFLQKEYQLKTGEPLSLSEPRKYTEKMQYAKLYDNSPIKTLLTDKYLVRRWIADKIGSNYLIPMLGVWEKYQEIDFKSLPEKFVLKTNHGAGMNLVVTNKEKINHHIEKIRFNRWLNKNFAYMGGLELHYKNIEPKIIAEEYVVDSNGELNDYKFLCFNGKPYYCWVDIGRYSDHYRNVYDMDWNLQPWNYNNSNNSPYKVLKPKNFEKMINIATVLSEGFSHVRVDLYNVDGEIYFGEMTFTSASGFGFFNPREYNNKLGKLWNLNVDKN